MVRKFQDSKSDFRQRGAWESGRTRSYTFHDLHDEHDTICEGVAAGLARLHQNLLTPFAHCYKYSVIHHDPNKIRRHDRVIRRPSTMETDAQSNGHARPRTTTTNRPTLHSERQPRGVGPSIHAHAGQRRRRHAARRSQMAGRHTQEL